MITLNFLADIWTNTKIYLGRSNTYLTIINSLSILFLATERVKDYGVQLNMWSQISIALGLFCFLIFLGWFDTHFGLYKLETRKCSDNDPQKVETLEIVRRIEEKLK